MQKYIIVQSQNNQQRDEILGGTKEEISLHLEKDIQLQSVQQQVKNRKWDEEEHMLYIMFLQLNRQKIKSKLIRRSNSFYKQMSSFILSKTPVQCRSHHQKYEARYKYPHKIIREEKQKIDIQLYQKLEEKYKNNILPLKEFSNKSKQIPKPKQKKIKVTVSVDCQTQIQGIQFPLSFQKNEPPTYFMINPINMPNPYSNTMNQQFNNGCSPTIIFW